MVDEAGFRWSRRLADKVIIELTGRSGQQQCTPAPSAIGAGHAWQQCHRAQCLTTLREAGHAFTEPDEGRLGGSIERGEALYIRGRKPSDSGGPIGRETRQDFAFDSLEADSVAS